MAPSKPARAWNPSIGRRRSSDRRGTGRVVLGVGHEAAGAREAARLAELPPRAPQDVAAAERAVPLPRFSNGEIIYTIDVRETLAGRGTVINVLFRQRRKNGAWSKPKTVALTPLEAEHLVDADDREILSLLDRRRQCLDLRRDVRRELPALSRYVLIGPLEDRVLPMLARSGRGHLDRIGDEHGPFPLSWDDGPAWRFELEIAATRSTTGWSWTARSSADGERLALREPVLVLSARLPVHTDSMARLELDGGFAWLARLRASVQS